MAATTIVAPADWCHDGLQMQELAAGLVADAQAALAQTNDGCPADGMVVNGRPSADCCDAVILEITGGFASEVGRFPERASIGSGGACNLGANMTFTLHVLRPCQTVLRQNPKAPFPTAAERNTEGLGFIADWRALGQVWFPAACARLDALHLSVIWGEARAKSSQGGCGGLEWPFEVEMV